MKIIDSEKANLTPAIECHFEIVPAEAGLPPEAKLALESSFSKFFEEAQRLEKGTQGITSSSIARTARLEARALRIKSEHLRKELKADSLRVGKAIDGAHNILLALVVPTEKRLEAIEKQEERRLLKEEQDLERSRRQELEKFGGGGCDRNLGKMTSEVFAEILSDYQILFEAKAEIAAKAERDRLAAEEKREAEAKAMRAELAALRKREAEAERQRQFEAALERKAAEEREAEAALERKAAEEREAEADRKREAEAALERKAAEEREAEAERQRQFESNESWKKLKAAEAKGAKLRAEKKAAKEALEKLQAIADRLDRKALEADRLKAEAEERIRLAPDKDKLLLFCSEFKALPISIVESPSASELVQEIFHRRSSMIKWIKREIDKLY
tara:strand:+ start:967 stop:2136 length:1170 start_codon:yes stop_codon:yes gene_type:complete